MKRFRGFVIKEFYHIFRDYRTLLILFGMPAVQLLLFGYVITNEIKDAKIAILDQSKDQVTQQITQKILSSGYFLLKKNLTDYRQIDQSFREGDIKMVIVFDADFARRLQKDGKAKMQIIGDASDPNTANILVNYASGIVTNYLISTNAEKLPMQIIPEVRMQYNPQLKGVYMFVPGIMAMLLMLISALMTSISITREKELGTMELLLVSPLRPIQIIIGKVLPYVFLAFTDACIILFIGKIRFRSTGTGQPVLAVIRKLFIHHDGFIPGYPDFEYNQQPAGCYEHFPGCIDASYDPAFRFHFSG